MPSTEDLAITIDDEPTRSAQVHRLSSWTSRSRAPGGPRLEMADPLRPIARLHRIRRYCALGVGAVAIFALATAVLPPSHQRLSIILHYLPLPVAQAAAALVALCGLILLALLRGIRRGQRQAWALSCTALALAAALHLARGIDAFQSGASLVLLAVLLVERSAFTATADHRTRRSVIPLAAGGLIATIALTTASIEGFLAVDRDGRRLLPVHLALLGVAQRMVGVQTVVFPTRVNRFLSPTLLSVGLCLAGVTALVICRPLVERRHRGSHCSDAEARRLVTSHGGGTLDYFALRDDKWHYFAGETLITYAVHGGICLVSPDPVGPPAERVEAWAEFCKFADAHGWLVAVLGADQSWLPIYRQGGLRSLYIGDEAIVHVDDFSLSGGHKKGLRQAVNRIARYGYRVSFHHAHHLDPALASSLRNLMHDSRRGQAERGFSMTLGRLCNTTDADVLLAVAHRADGAPVAFCQFVPAPSIGGYSLDLMRRDQGQHPNGLIDFLLVSTIDYLRQQGMAALGLNFATMRAIVADDVEGRMRERLLRWGCRKLSPSMQIESLWRFSAKYDPEWLARYLVFGSVEHLLAVGLAVAQAESFWELPLIGRYLTPDHQRAVAEARQDPEAA